MVKALRGNPVGVRVLLGILALLLAAGALALGSANSARADTTPSPTPTASTAPETIQIWVRLASDKSPVRG